jgi:hypothetical protein
MICENCGNEHDGTYGSGRFCRQSCSRSFSTKLNREEISKKVSITLGGTGILKEKFCVYCGEPLKKNARKFCSNQCQQDYQFQQYINKIEKLGYIPNMSSTASGAATNSIKRYLIYKFGQQCQICKNTEWLKQPINLWLDHIDGKANNWKLNNLRLVCPNCDSYSDTYCGRNKGNSTRPKRKFI